MQRNSKFFLLILVLTLSTSAQEEEKPLRSYLWPPLFSLFVPGLDQWIQKEYLPASLYTATAIGGIGLFASQPGSARGANPFDTKDDGVRLATLGSTLYGTSGFYSLFHSFKNVVESRPDFTFLKNGERIDDVLLAPFHFSYLRKATTLIPLAVVTALVASGTLFNSEANVIGLTMGDVAFSSGISYMAGTGESAIFQGWMMPVLMHWTDSSLASNLLTSGLFAAAHLSRVKFPIIQFLNSFYSGWLVQKSNWTIAEVAFIHVWWDVIAILGNFAFDRVADPMVIRLPPLMVTL